MRAYEFIDNIEHVLETTSSGATSTGNIAGVSSPIGGVIKRMPTTPNLFGYIPAVKNKTKKKRKSSR